MNRIQIHFDGDIVINHQVSMRTLGRTLNHLQNAMDRAYIENKYGEVWKHTRMKVTDYKETEFLVQEPKEGGYILDFLANNIVTKGIIDRISSAITPALEQAMQDGESVTRSLAEQISTRDIQVKRQIIKPIGYEQLVNNPSEQIIRKYGDRSITKEIDQILSIIRSNNSGQSTFELITHGSVSP